MMKPKDVFSSDAVNLSIPRQDLLGHRSRPMTTHYSAPELSRLLKSANQVCERRGKKPQLVMLRRRSAA